MRHRLSLALLTLLAGFCMASFSSCGDTEEEELQAGGIYGQEGTLTFTVKGGTLQVGYVKDDGYFEHEARLEHLPNIIVTARGDVADVVIEGFSTSNDEATMSNFSIIDMKIEPSRNGTLTFVRNISSLAGSLNKDGRVLLAQDISLKGLKVSDNRIAINELRIFFGENATYCADCVRMMDIQGVIKSKN